MVFIVYIGIEYIIGPCNIYIYNIYSYILYKHII